MSTKTILVPVDFQEASLEAIAVARDLAKPLGLEVVLLHVFSIPVVAYPGFDPIIAPGLPEEVATTAQKALERLMDQAGATSTMLRSGDAADEIVKAIDDLDPYLVAMGTHARKGLSHLLLGSVAEKVIRRSKVPVITVRAPARQAAKEPSAA